MDHPLARAARARAAQALAPTAAPVPKALRVVEPPPVVAVEPAPEASAPPSARRAGEAAESPAQAPAAAKAEKDSVNVQTGRLTAAPARRPSRPSAPPAPVSEPEAPEEEMADEETSEEVEAPAHATGSTSRGAFPVLDARGTRTAGYPALRVDGQLPQWCQEQRFAAVWPAAGWWTGLLWPAPHEKLPEDVALVPSGSLTPSAAAEQWTVLHGQITPAVAGHAGWVLALGADETPVGAWRVPDEDLTELVATLTRARASVPDQPYWTISRSDLSAPGPTDPQPSDSEPLPPEPVDEPSSWGAQDDAYDEPDYEVYEPADEWIDPWAQAFDAVPHITVEETSTVDVEGW